MGSRSHNPEKKINEVAIAKTLLHAIQIPDISLRTKNDAINCGSYSKGIFINKDKPINDWTDFGKKGSLYERTQQNNKY